MTDEILDLDPAHSLVDKFFHTILPAMEKGSVLELGSRAQSVHTRKALVPEQLQYVGFDIKEGPNVDVIGDAHKLSQYFKPEMFSAIFSIAVFEHIAMPWKVAIELNKALEVGGIMMHIAPQAWPIHEMPWDYFRYSEYAWKTLFNKKTGFEILEVKMGEPGRVQPDYIHAGVEGVPDFPVYLMTTVICKKISQTELQWNVDLSEIVDFDYPH
jgi:hypothetical protein